MKRHYLSPTTEVVNLNTDDLAAGIGIGHSKADGGDAMAKPNTGIFEYEDDADETPGYNHTNLWEDE